MMAVVKEQTKLIKELILDKKDELNGQNAVVNESDIDRALNQVFNDD